MKKKRAKEIKKQVREYMRDNRMDLRYYKGACRRAKKDYNMGII